MEGDNLRKVRTVLLIIFFANILVAIIKIILGSIIDSSSLTADGFHSLSDGASNIVGLIGIWFASKPVDKDHPYGHRKFETLAGLFIGIMLSAVGINIIIGAVQRFINPIELSIDLESIITLIITLVINILVSGIEYKKGREYHSQILVSDSLHTRSDVFVSVGVLATVIGVRLGAPSIIDPIASLIVAGFIFHAAVEIFRESSGVLVDKAAVDSDRVKDVVTEFLEVKDVHNIRSRGTIDTLHVDLHVMTDPAMSVEESHKLIHRIEDRLKEEFSKNTQVIIHLEPYYSRADTE